MNKKEETVKVFGSVIARWKNCPECGAELSCEFKDYLYGYAPRCNKCQSKRDAEDIRKNSKVKKTFTFVKKYAEAVAFGHERITGRQVAITNDGRRVDPSETRYDLKGDPRGWKVAGKKVRETDSQGLPTNR